MPNPTSGSTSGPTERVLDVLELLTRPGAEPLRFTDVAREAGLTQGTANAILGTLVERGWLERGPLDKRYAVGAGLVSLATRVQAGRTSTLAATAAARALAERTGIAVSVTEKVGDEVAIVAFEGGDPEGLRGKPGDLIPYAPPFGLTFVAWEDDAGRRAWMQRATETPAVADGLTELLTATRERGFSVERMTDAMAGAAELISALGTRDAGSLSSVMRRIMDELLVDYLGPSGQQRADPQAPVILISAPVLDEGGRVTVNLALHPLRPMSDAEAARLGAEVVATCARLGPATA